MFNTIRRSLLLTMAFFPAVTAAAETSAPLHVEAWSLARLDLEIRVMPEKKRIELRGKALVRLDDAASDGPAFAINSRKQVMRFRKLEAGDVTASLGPFRSGSPIEVAKVSFPKLFRKGDTVEVTFLTESVETSSQFVAGERSAFASWVEFWYPVPGKSLTELASPAAPGSTTFVMPPGWRSVSNGRLVSRTVSAGEARETWTSEVPVARSFVAAPFQVAETVERGGREIAYFLLEPRTTVPAQAAALAESLAAMEQRFGPYPYPTYGIVEVPEEVSFAAASEQGFIMVRGSLLDSVQGNLPLFAHEAAHGWWGNLVQTTGPGASMVSEALAQYGAVVAIEALEGTAAVSEFLRYSRQGYHPLQCALGYFHIWREGGDKPLSKLGGGKWDHNLSDSKGHWFYHMLRQRVGDAAFFGTLRRLIEQYRGRQLSLDDLRGAFIAARPDDAGLRAFLEQWLDRTAAPVPRIDWWSVDRGRGVEIHIEQRQAGEAFNFPLELAIETVSGETVRATVEICASRQRIVLATPSRPTQIRLDPNDRLLIWRPEYGEPPM